MENWIIEQSIIFQTSEMATQILHKLLELLSHYVIAISPDRDKLVLLPRFGWPINIDNWIVINTWVDAIVYTRMSFINLSVPELRKILFLLEN